MDQCWPPKQHATMMKISCENDEKKEEEKSKLENFDAFLSARKIGFAFPVLDTQRSRCCLEWGKTWVKMMKNEQLIGWNIEFSWKRER